MTGRAGNDGQDEVSGSPPGRGSRRRGRGRRSAGTDRRGRADGRRGGSPGSSSFSLRVRWCQLTRIRRTGRASRHGWASALPVALPPDDQGVAVVGQAVEGSAGEQAVAERVGPLVEGAVAGDDERFALV